MLADDVLIADRLDGAPSPGDHGVPVWLVSPKQYGATTRRTSPARAARASRWCATPSNARLPALRRCPYIRARGWSTSSATTGPAWSLRFEGSAGNLVLPAPATAWRGKSGVAAFRLASVSTMRRTLIALSIATRRADRRHSGPRRRRRRLPAARGARGRGRRRWSPPSCRRRSPRPPHDLQRHDPGAPATSAASCTTAATARRHHRGDRRRVQEHRALLRDHQPDRLLRATAIRVADTAGSCSRGGWGRSRARWGGSRAGSSTRSARAPRARSRSRTCAHRRALDRLARVWIGSRAIRSSTPGRSSSRPRTPSASACSSRRSCSSPDPPQPPPGSGQAEVTLMRRQRQPLRLRHRRSPPGLRTRGPAPSRARSPPDAVTLDVRADGTIDGETLRTGPLSTGAHGRADRALQFLGITERTTPRTSAFHGIARRRGDRPVRHARHCWRDGGAAGCWRAVGSAWGRGQLRHRRSWSATITAT